MKRWTDDEIAQLREFASRGWSASRIGRQLRRSAAEVQRKRSELKLPRSTDPFDGPTRVFTGDLARKGACSRWHGRDCECWRGTDG